MAAFAVYNANLEEYGTVSAGLRYEHVGFDYMDNLDAENNIARYQDEFFPNITWSKQFGAIQTSLSYTMKTVRPNGSTCLLPTNVAITPLHRYQWPITTRVSCC